jgi:hypothetical protein
MSARSSQPEAPPHDARPQERRFPRDCSTGCNDSDNTIWLTSTSDVAREIASESFMRVRDSSEKANIVAAYSARVRTATQPAGRPARVDRDSPVGRVIELRGIIFQSDNHSVLGAWLIRPIQMFDRRLAGLGKSVFGPPLAMHVGLHVVIEDGREFVVEQLFGTPWHAFIDGVSWTPLEVFRARDRGGWDVTVPASAFRKIDDRITKEAIEFLNSIQSRPYFGEDCPTFVERAFGRRRLFADSPTARWLGFGVRIGDPALPLLRPEVRLDRRAERLLRAWSLRTLPDPITSWNAPNARFLLHRMIFLGGFLLTGLLFGLLRARSTSGGFRTETNPLRGRSSFSTT